MSTDLNFLTDSEHDARRPNYSTIHELVLTVLPREVIDGRELEAEFEVEVAHPEECPAGITDEDFCPVAAHELACGIDESFTDPFGEPDELDEFELAALNGKRIAFAMSSRLTGGGYPDYDWDVEEDFVYDDGRSGARAVVEHMAAGQPPVCARCGSWQRSDGSTGPTLPACTDDAWAHEETCRTWFGQWSADHLCASCESKLNPSDAVEETP